MLASSVSNVPFARQLVERYAITTTFEDTPSFLMVGGGDAKGEQPPAYLLQSTSAGAGAGHAAGAGSGAGV